jgi:hypothetical protein
VEARVQFPAGTCQSLDLLFRMEMTYAIPVLVEYPGLYTVSLSSYASFANNRIFSHMTVCKVLSVFGKLHVQYRYVFTAFPRC